MLDVRQTDLPHLDLVHQALKRVLHLSELGFRHSLFTFLSCPFLAEEVGGLLDHACEDGMHSSSSLSHELPPYY